MSISTAVGQTDTNVISLALNQDVFFLQGIIDEIYRVTPMLRFKTLFAEAGRALRHKEKIDDRVRDELIQAFRQTLSHVNRLIYHTTRFNDHEKKLVGDWLHGEFLAFCELGTWPARALRKPQGIAGDHYTISQIYFKGNKENRPLGDIVNACFLNEPACRAVINRELHVRNVIMQLMEKNAETPTRVVSMASGPANELFAVYDSLDKDQAKRLKAVGIDMDKRACASVDDGINERKLSSCFSTEARNVLRLGTLPSHLTEQDLVYTMGLIDYFNDKLVIKTLNSIYDMLKVGGSAIVGNFHTSCDSRIFLDYLLDWQLIYRTEDDMKRLFASSKFAGCEVSVEFEKEEVNMLARCTKQ